MPPIGGWTHDRYAAEQKTPPRHRRRPHAVPRGPADDPRDGRRHPGGGRRRQGRSSSNRDENGLTEREREIVRLVASGQKNKEVGATLAISERTVKTHLTNVFQKLGVRDRVGLVMYALRHGLTRAA